MYFLLRVCIFHVNLGDFFRYRVQNNLNNHATSQGPATSESSNFPVPRSSALTFDKSKDFNDTKHDSIVEKGENSTVAATTKADMELIAQNRDNAMQRYREKKKIRRFDSLILIFFDTQQYYILFYKIHTQKPYSTHSSHLQTNIYRYDKHIRYESRKARADTRKRVKGRFVKTGEDQDS